ncbi:MAG TPA: DUF4097 family beta strand repeat-containing protein [Candidatus Cloacimonadota bacterium]|nr:DUF4097 family beta strand repeat-containing protein [Candidatus Cloacimonadota bacterium]HOH59346.1 DUF4097 family beta strand repeat-containing protein [Candidatus Cloacimonadota bacterium]HPI25202.1 DUF4097 family beta strand repeat-containing protein [Candidatus Cloacimonadota bacterium]
MKKYAIQKKWANVGLSEIRLDNALAPLVIDDSADDAVLLEGLLNFEADQEDLNIEDYINAELDAGILTLKLDELPVNQRDIKTAQIKLSVPGKVFLNVSTDNFPLSLIGLENNLKISSDNSPVSIKHCRGDLHLESENGPVKLHNIRGNIYARMENGPVVAEDIVGEGLHIESENGPIKLRLASYKTVDLETENGPIHFETQPVEGGNFKFTTENGIVHLVLPLRFSFKLSAETESGRFKSNLDSEVVKDDRTFRIENLYDDDEPTMISINTENGLIKLSSDGHINLDFIKTKLDQLKDSISGANTGNEKEKVNELLGKLIEYLSRATNSINEEKIKSKVNEAIDKMKAATKDIDLEGTKTVVISKVEDLSSEIYDGLKEGLRGVKAEFDGLKYEHLNADSLKEYINKVVNSPLIKPYLSAERKKQEQEEIANRSRLKILDMLEAGKITSEEAERLLKAIHKE